ncbi:MAG: hypothetical protein WDM80_17655 [Limisphaerales bacterium]
MRHVPAFGDQDRCLLEVANLSANPRSTKILVQTGTNVPQSQLGVTRRTRAPTVRFNIPSGMPSLQAVLEPDALAEDNEVHLLPRRPQAHPCSSRITNESFSALVNRTLDATGLRAAISDNPELVIHDTDGVVNSNSWSLRCLMPAKRHGVHRTVHRG